MVRAFAEWEEQDMLLVSLPHINSDWKDYLDEITNSYKELVLKVAKFQKVGVISPFKSDFKRLFKDVKNVSFFEIKTDDTWIRDYGPIDVLKDNNIISYNFKFNAWGDKFESKFDNLVNKELAKKIDYNLVDIDLVLEGGSVDFNGDGVMLTTSKCLLNKNRNPNLNKFKLENRLKELFGLKKIIWLENGFIKGDDTDSHIDILARFIGKNCIAFSSCDDRDDIHYNELKEMKKELIDSGFDLVELPIPAPIFYEGKRLGATYTNFIFINGALIVPTYNDKNDEIVINRLKKALPNKEIIGVDSRVFIRQGGSLHCSSQNRFSRAKFEMVK